MKTLEATLREVILGSNDTYLYACFSLLKLAEGWSTEEQQTRISGLVSVATLVFPLLGEVHLLLYLASRLLLVRLQYICQNIVQIYAFCAVQTAPAISSRSTELLFGITSSKSSRLLPQKSSPISS